MPTNARGKQLLTSGNPTEYQTGVTGTSRNDNFHGTRGQSLAGGLGDDTYHLWDSTARAVEGARGGVDTVYAHFWGTAVLADNIENLVLMSPGSIAGTGNALDNIITAGQVGADLNGLAGDDVLVGGAGGDLFRIGAGNGSDAVIGFEQDHDVVLLSGYDITSFSQILEAGRQDGSDVRFTFANREQLVLRDVDLSSLNPWDFGFAAPEAAIPVGGRSMTGFTNAYNAHGWYVLNGLWNLGDATERSAIRTVFDPNDVTAGVVFNWNLPHSTSAPIIRGYPEVQFGVNPHGSYAGNPTDNYRVFPIRVSDIVSLTADFDVSYSGNLAGFNVAYDIWFTNAPNGNASAISNEIMVWLHEGDFAPFGDVIGTYTHDGLTATIYHAGTYTAFVFDGDVTKGVLDIADLIGTLRDMGIIDESEYLASVELGAEVVSGIGSLTVNNLDLEVVTRDENGTIVIENVTGAGTTVREVVPVDEPNVDTPSIPKEDGPPTLPDDDDEEAPSGSTSPTPEHSVTKGAPVNGGCVMEVIKQDTSFAGFEAFAGASTPSYGHLDAMVELKDIGGEVLFAGYAVAADDAPGFSGDAVLAFGSHDLGASDFFLI